MKENKINRPIYFTYFLPNIIVIYFIFVYIYSDLGCIKSNVINFFFYSNVDHEVPQLWSSTKGNTIMDTGKKRGIRAPKDVHVGDF